MKNNFKMGIFILTVLSMIVGMPKTTLATSDDIKDSECELRYKKDPVQENKNWKIKFDKKLNTSSISSDNVLFQDEDGHKIYSSVSLDESDKDKKTVIVRPNSRFKQGKRYSITIKRDGFKDEKYGKKIKKPVRMFFYIKNAFAGLPCEDGLIVVRNMVYSIDYLAKNSKLKNEILNEDYTIYYCYSETEQKVKDIFGNIQLDKDKIHPHYDNMIYVNGKGEKSIYQWDSSSEEYNLVEVAVDADITVNSSAKVVTVRIKNVQGIDDAVYFKLRHSNDVKRIGESIAFTSKNLVEPIYILNYNKNVIAKGKLNTHFSTSKITNLIKVGDINKGNTAGNINNNGYVVEDQEGYVFYNNTGDRNSLYKLDSNGMFNNAIAKDSAQYINVVGDWVYYSNYSDKGNLYKIKTDGTLRQKISDGMASYVTVSGDWIYFCNHSDGGRLYKIRPDGTSKMRVSQTFGHETAYINISGDWIYFTDVTDRHRPYIINTDGTYLAKLSEEWANSIQVYGEWIYYTSSTGVLSKVRKDGSGEVIPIKGQTREFDKGFHINVVGEWLYYSNYLDGGKLYKIRTNGSGEKQKLLNELVDYINIIDDQIYFTAKGKLFRLPIDTDGTIKPQQISKSNGQHNIIQMDDLKATVAFEDVNMKLVDMENKYLPEKVPGIMDDNTMHQFSVDWDRKHATARNGVRTYIGDVIGYNRKIKFELTIPSEMLNEANTITVYNNSDKNSDVIIVENLYDNNLISTPPKLNVGDLVSVYDNESCTKLLGKAVVARDGKYNKAKVERIELDKYGQRSAWITVTRVGKAESKPTEVRHGDVPGISKAEDLDNQENFRFYEKGLGLGVNGKDLAITEWVPSQVMGKTEYYIYVLSGGKLDISKESCIPVATITKNDRKWQGNEELRIDSNKKDLRKGKYNTFIVGTFEGEASQDNRGKRPYVKGSVCSDPKTFDVTEEVIPKSITLKTKGSVQGGADIVLNKAPAIGEQVWLIPTNSSRTIMEKVENWRSDNDVKWPINELKNVGTCLEGDGSTTVIEAPKGMNPKNPNYKDIEYSVLVVNKIGSAGFSKEHITVDNKSPELFNEFAHEKDTTNRLKIGTIKPEDGFKVKVFDEGSNLSTINDSVSVYIVERGVEDFTKELLDTAVKQKIGKVFNVNKGIPYSCNITGLEAITKEEFERHYRRAGSGGIDLTNYKVLAVDKAGNICTMPVYFNIIVDTEKLKVLINKSEQYLFMLNDDQHKTLDPVLKQAKDILSLATTKRQHDIDSICDRLESSMEKVGIPGITADHKRISKAVSNGVYLKDKSKNYVKQGSTIDYDLTFDLNTSVDKNIRIQWVSDTPNVISNNGQITRPLKNKTVKLTATISYNNENNTKFTREFNVIVKGVDIMSQIYNVAYDSASKKIAVEFSKAKEDIFVDYYRVIVSKKTINNPSAKNGVMVGTSVKDDVLKCTGINKDVEGNVLAPGTYYVYVLSVAKQNRGVIVSQYRTLVLPK